MKKKENICLLIHGDSKTVLKRLKKRVDLIVTSPPYADARKNHYDSVHPDEYADWFLGFHEVLWDALKPEGSFVLNIKDKVVDGVRHRFVWDTICHLNRKGWLSIDDYIWHKPNPMPGYWPTRLRDGWEYCFHLAKQKKPYMNQDSVKIPVGDWVNQRLQNLGTNDLARHNSSNNSGFGRDISRWKDKKEVLPPNVLSIPLVGKNQGHPAAFPVELPSFFIKLFSKPHDLILDPFAGSGTTGIATLSLGRDCILIDNNFDYCTTAFARLISQVGLLLSDVVFIGQNGRILESTDETHENKSIEELLDIYSLTA